MGNNNRQDNCNTPGKMNQEGKLPIDKIGNTEYHTLR